MANYSIIDNEIIDKVISELSAEFGSELKIERFPTSIDEYELTGQGAALIKSLGAQINQTQSGSDFFEYDFHVPCSIRIGLLILTRKEFSEERLYEYCGRAESVLRNLIIGASQDENYIFGRLYPTMRSEAEYDNDREILFLSSEFITVGVYSNLIED